MKKTYILEDLCCAHCAAEIENKVKKLAGVQDAAVNFLTTKMIVECEEMTDSMMKEIKKIVKKVDSDIEMVEK